jgi:Novel STAND NTPase 1
MTVEHHELRRNVDSEVDGILSADPTERATQLKGLREAFIPLLITIDGDDQCVRRVARWSQLPETSQPLIDALVAKQLLLKERRYAAGNGQLGEVVVEIPHDSHLHQWGELDNWLRERRRHLTAAKDLQRHVAGWEANGHNTSWLLTGTRLIDAEIVADTAEFRDGLAHSREYLIASRRNENIRLENENQRHHNELAAANKRLEEAHAFAAAKTEACALAQEQALMLSRRVRVLQAALIAMALIAAIAVVAAIS